MPPSVPELIGQVLHPRAGASRPAVPRPMACDAPLDVLIGRVVGPPGARSAPAPAPLLADPLP